MSIASEYAKRVKAAAKKPKCFEWYERPNDPYCLRAHAQVTKEGNLFSSHLSLPPKQALELAAWIVKTFGEEK